MKQPPPVLKPRLWWAIVRKPNDLPDLFRTKAMASTYGYTPIRVLVKLAPKVPAWKRNRVRVQRQALRDLGGVQTRKKPRR